MSKKIKVARFAVNFNATDASGNSKVRFSAGSDYPLEVDADGELKRCIARGIAEEVEVDAPEEPAAAETDAATSSEAAPGVETATATDTAAEAKPAAKAKK